MRVLFDFGRGEAFAATTRLFSFGGGVPLPELELPPPPPPLPLPPPPLVAGRVTETIVELAEPGRNVEAVEGRSLMVLEYALSCFGLLALGWPSLGPVARVRKLEQHQACKVRTVSEIKSPRACVPRSRQSLLASADIR